MIWHKREKEKPRTLVTLWLVLNAWKGKERMGIEREIEKRSEDEKYPSFAHTHTHTPLSFL